MTIFDCLVILEKLMLEAYKSSNECVFEVEISKGKSEGRWHFLKDFLS